MKLSRKVLHAGKDLCNVLVIEKQSGAEECNQLKEIFFSVLCSRHERNTIVFVRLGRK